MVREDIEIIDIRNFNRNIYTYMNDENLKLEAECNIIDFIVNIKERLENGQRFFIQLHDMYINDKDDLENFINTKEYKDAGIDELKNKFLTEREKIKKYHTKAIEIIEDNIALEYENIENASDLCEIKLYESHISHYKSELEDHRKNLSAVEDELNK